MSEDTIRRSARGQALPDSERQVLASLRGDDLHIRCRELYEAGWTLRAIADATTPAVSRSAVHGWVSKTMWAPTLPFEELPPVPVPTYKTTAEYVPKTKPSPGIAASTLSEIQFLAPKARKYRARVGPSHPANIANNRLTSICQTLYAGGVPIQELADAAGVSYRAMAKRVSKS